MDKKQIDEIIKALEKINIKINELKTSNDYLIDEIQNNATIDDIGIETNNLKQIKTKISNIAIDIKEQIIPKLEEEIS